MRDLSLLALMSPPGSHASPCAFIPADGAAIALPPGDADTAARPLSRGFPSLLWIRVMEAEQ